MLAIFNVGGGEIVLILAIVLILFGAKKLPELAKGLGQGIREFKKATDNASEGMRHAIEETVPVASRRLPPPPAETEHTVSQVLPVPRSDLVPTAVPTNIQSPTGS
jgi:sec-independent protein translocase protein TatA